MLYVYCMYIVYLKLTKINHHAVFLKSRPHRNVRNVHPQFVHPRRIPCLFACCILPTNNPMNRIELLCRPPSYTNGETCFRLMQKIFTKVVASSRLEAHMIHTRLNFASESSAVVRVTAFVLLFQIWHATVRTAARSV